MWPMWVCTESQSSYACRIFGFTTSPLVWALVNTNTTPMLLKLDDMMAAYDTFGRAAETKALKVIIER